MTVAVARQGRNLFLNSIEYTAPNVLAMSSATPRQQPHRADGAAGDAFVQPQILRQLILCFLITMTAAYLYIYGSS